MNYPAELEALDRKHGHVHTMDDWRRIGEKEGADLTDDDIVVCGFFGGPQSAAQARARRMLALNEPAPAPAPVTKSPAAPAYVTRKFLDTQFTSYTEALVAIVKAERTRIAALEKRISELERRPLVKYAGVHVEGQSYSEAQLVTRA